MIRQVFINDAANSAFAAEDISKIQMNPEDRAYRHIDKCTKLLSIVSGQLCVTLNGRDFSLDENDSLVIFKGIPHKISVPADSPCEFYSLHFHPSSESQLQDFNTVMAGTNLPELAKISYNFRRFFLYKGNERICRYVHAIYRELSEKKLYWRKLTDLQMYSLILLFLREIDCPAGESNYKADYLLSAVRFIMENYMNKLSVADIARHCGLSSRYLNKLFQDSFGLNVLRFIRFIRIDKAMEILFRDPKTCLTDIALQVGFCNLQHFSKNFKEELGISPKRYALALTEK